MKKVLIFGSTGSIGRNALRVIRRDREKFKVCGLSAQRDIHTLYRQIKEFTPSYVYVRDDAAARNLKMMVGRKVKVLGGEAGLNEFSSIKSDISLMAISGISCLTSLLINIRHTRRIALANKESLVAAGPFIFDEASRHNTEILPVDSEINALFQLIRVDSNHIRKIYLTASGGPLLNYRKKDLENVGVKEVLSHPTWQMGKRITVDSATLVNKGFEVIETHFFFNLPYEKIDIIVHQESTVHALVEFNDRAIFAYAYSPDMRIPLSSVFHYPQRCSFSRGVNFQSKFSLTFSPLNYRNFPLLEIILEGGKRGDNSLTILNACDEIVIEHFLNGKIRFTHLIRAMEYIFEHYPQSKIKSIEDVFFWDKWGRIKTEEYLKKIKNQNTKSKNCNVKTKSEK